MNINEKQHEMVLEKTHPSGAQEWYCPTCGRRIRLQYHAAEDRLDVETVQVGNQLVPHFGSQGGLRIKKPATNPIKSKKFSA